MKTLANHKGMQLRDDAAASWDRFERDHGVHTVTSAHRPQSEQDVLIRRWNTGGKYNRPPYLYEPARVSKHTSGVAIDTPNAEGVAKAAVAYGWRFLFAYDKVHLEYDPAYDLHKEAPARPVVRLGSRGKDVRDLQSILTRYHGAKLAVDGIYGTGTRTAVQAFQRAHGLFADGIVGVQTWRKLGQ